MGLALFSACFGLFFCRPVLVESVELILGRIGVISLIFDPQSRYSWVSEVRTHPDSNGVFTFQLLGDHNLIVHKNGSGMTLTLYQKATGLDPTHERVWKLRIILFNHKIDFI